MIYDDNTDHLGRKFPSEESMCKYWGILPITYQIRILNGWSVKRALTTPEAVPATDHLGHIFPSERSMCRNWHIPHSVYQERIKQGFTVEQALTTPPPFQPKKLDDRVRLLSKLDNGDYKVCVLVPKEEVWTQEQVDAYKESIKKRKRKRRKKCTM